MSKRPTRASKATTKKVQALSPDGSEGDDLQMWGYFNFFFRFLTSIVDQIALKIMTAQYFQHEQELLQSGMVQLTTWMLC